MAQEISKEKLEEIKKSLLKNLHFFPENQRDSMKKKIEKMEDKEFLQFLTENRLLENKKENTDENCVFCSIIAGKIPSYKISETENDLAILEINPLSQAHTLIIPKKHTGKNQIQEHTKKFAKEIEKQIKEKLSPIEIKSVENEVLGHITINLIPIYSKEQPTNQRYKASEKELKEIQDKLTKKPIVLDKQPKLEKLDKEKKEEKQPLQKLKPRIP